jgi:modification methylase
VAKKRIAAVEPLPEDWLLANTQDPEPPARIPFPVLLEAGLLKAGDQLRHVAIATEAVVNADGSLTVDGCTGSIHKVGAFVAGTPACNGWTHWTFLCPNTGLPRLLDELREQLRCSTLRNP